MLPGTLIDDRYRIDREIGKGSFGIVYLVHDLRTNEPRAIKVLLPWAARNEQLRHRLRREARLAGSLTSPHAVKIHELGETERGDVFLVMEYLEGQELAQLLQSEKTLPPPRVEQIAVQVLAALEEAHALGVIHRDLKPSNIFLCKSDDQTDHIKVFDFGIAKITGDGGLLATMKLTLSGNVMGTPLYMSPEQSRGTDLTPAADFYSLGIVLYELLTGSVPFDDINPVQVLMKHSQDPVPPLPEIIAATPLGKAVMRSLAKEPEQRFQSASDFLRALQGHDVPLPPPAAPPAPTPGPLPTPQPGQPSKTPRSGSPHWGWWLVPIAVLLAATAIWLLAQATQ